MIARFGLFCDSALAHTPAPVNLSRQQHASQLHGQADLSSRRKGAVMHLGTKRGRRGRAKLVPFNASSRSAPPPRPARSGTAPDHHEHGRRPC